MEKLSHIIDDGVVFFNFDASSRYLSINLQKVLISFLEEKPRSKSLLAKHRMSGRNVVIIMASITISNQL